MMRSINEEVRGVWDALSEDARKDLKETIDQLPDELKGWKRLIDRAKEHLHWVTGMKRSIAIVGPANAGKSTLYNALIRSKRDRAVVGATPGTTREVQEADAGIFEIVDTPGMDAIGDLGEAEREKALHAAMNADLIILLFDASHGIREVERQIFDQLLAGDKPMVIALNKIDLVSRERNQVLQACATALGLPDDQILPMSALRETGIGQLLSKIVMVEPEIVAALGVALPAYRWKLAQAVIARAASASAAVALTPLPFLDFFPLLGIQGSMVLTIARIYSFKLTLARARELLAAFGAGLIGRSLFYELSKFGGPPGWLISAAVAAGTTTALGRAASVWFERGSIPTKEEVGDWARQFSGQIRERLMGLGKRRPRRIELQEAIIDEVNKEHSR
jgi:GTP-binding protein Era